MTQEDLDQLREEHPINGALQDLLAFIIHTEENSGAILPQNVLYLATAAKQATDLLLTECRRLQDENGLLQHRNLELQAYIAASAGMIGGRA